MAEDPELFPAQSLSPQRVCLEGIDGSDILVLILGQCYGDLTESDLSAVEEEYWHARLDEKEIKVFVHSLEREPQQDEFLERMGNKWEKGHFRNPFDSPEDLKSKITQALSTMPESLARRTRTPLREGIHDWLICLKKYTDIMTAGSGRPLMDCVRLAQVDLVKWLVDDYGFEKWEALQVVSQVATIRIGNIVDPNYTVIAKFPKKYLAD